MKARHVIWAIMAVLYLVFIHQWYGWFVGGSYYINAPLWQVAVFGTSPVWVAIVMVFAATKVQRILDD
jgi:hypothetical protein